MPRKAKKNSAHRPVADSIKHDISSAVEQIPHLLYHSFQEKKESNEKPAAPISVIKNYQQNRGGAERAKKNLLLVGVTCITVIILAMWGWNMRVFWYHTQEITEHTPPVWEDAKHDLSSVLDKAAEQRKSIDNLVKKINTEEKKQDAQAISDAMATLIIASASSTPTTTNP